MADCGISWHTHDPGVVLTHLAVAMADGADCLSDMAVLKEQSELFGPVASVATAWRSVQATSQQSSGDPRPSPAAREEMWEAPATAQSLVIDFDATFVTAHSEKEDAAATYKGGSASTPWGSWCDTTSEPLAAMLRPGTPGQRHRRPPGIARTRRSLFAGRLRIGHEEGDDPKVVHQILVRADSAAASHRFCGARDANIDFSIGFTINGQVRDALLLVQEEDWVPAIEFDGPSAPVHRSMSSPNWSTSTTWPEGTRLICRRERPHPGAQLTLFDTQKVSGTPALSPIRKARHRHARTAPPWTCEGRRPGAHLEGLRVEEPPLRGLRQQPGVAGGLPRRRSTHGVDAAHLLQRRTRQSRAQAIRYRVLHVAAQLAHHANHSRPPRRVLAMGE